MIRQLRPACRWAEIALAGAVINLAVLLLAPIARPDLDLLDKPLSYYVDGPWGILQTVAFAAMGVSLLALALALAWTATPSRRMVICLLSLAISGVASFGLVAFPMGFRGPSTLLGDPHMTVGIIGGAAQLIAVLAFTLAIWHHEAWAGLRKFGAVVVALSLAGALPSQLANLRPDFDIPMGATIRLFVAPLVLFWGAVAFTLRRTCPS